MNIKIVTDSTSDLPAKLTRKLSITVVPAYVRFGNNKYRDRIDIFEDEFYKKLQTSTEVPGTEPPTPEDFADVYKKLSKNASGIISIHVSSKLSATCNSALRGVELAQVDYPIVVIDSQLVTMGLGLLVLEANNIANSGQCLPNIVDEINKIIPRISMLGFLDTLKYLNQGGRIGKAKALLGSVLSLKPLLSLRDGEIEPIGQVRSRPGAIDELFNFVSNTPNIVDSAIIYSTTPDDARVLAEHMSSILHKDQIKLARLGPVLGVHTGPGILFVALRTN